MPPTPPPPPPLNKPSAMFFGVSKGAVIITVIGWVISIEGTRKNACFAMGLKGIIGIIIVASFWL